MAIKSVLILGIVVLALNHFPRGCQGALPKAQYECKNLPKGMHVCNVTLKVNETLFTDCENAAMFTNPMEAYMNSKKFCTAKDRKYFDDKCDEEAIAKIDSNRVIKFDEDKTKDRTLVLTNQNNPDDPKEGPQISWSCKAMDKSAMATFNVKFSKEVNSDVANTKVKSMWASGAFGFTDRLSTAIAFSAAVAMASLAGISV